MVARWLSHLERRTVELDGVARDVFVGGDGPAVVVMHEIPGVDPTMIGFARRLIRAGMSVYLPSLVGQPGRRWTTAYAAGSIARACVAREFATWATGTTSPIVRWLRSLARLAHAERGGPGVGAIGMCLTGGFALAMMIDPTVVAPVLAQPSLPFPLTAAHRRDLGVDPVTLACAAARAREGVDVMGLRFSHDVLVPDARWARLREVLGDRFLAVEIDSGPGNRHGIGPLAHSVVVKDLVDRPGHPTRLALEQVIGFFQTRLGLAPA
ncbi:MAG TPA: dienelactone hydrolase family protein [Kofleriaceae bacterium]|nr:dienelactone hydrolase family protein [Kofleriaceae bacterium]